MGGEVLGIAASLVDLDLPVLVLLHLHALVHLLVFVEVEVVVSVSRGLLVSISEFKVPRFLLLVVLFLVELVAAVVKFIVQLLLLPVRRNMVLLRLLVRRRVRLVLGFLLGGEGDVLLGLVMWLVVRGSELVW